MSGKIWPTAENTDLTNKYLKKLHQPGLLHNSAGSKSLLYFTTSVYASHQSNCTFKLAIPSTLRSKRSRKMGVTMGCSFVRRVEARRQTIMKDIT